MFKLNRFLGRIIPIGCLSLLLSIILFSNSWAYADTTADQAKPPELSQLTPLKQPIVLESENGVLDVKLSVEYDAGTIGKNNKGEDNNVCLRSYKLISYKGIRTPNPDETSKFVAPTLKVNPGDKLKISIENKLPKYDEGEYSASQIALRTYCNPASKPQTLRSIPQIANYNITNLHTHGLEVSPEGISDNVFLTIQPGQTENYEFDISKDHAPGTFWYHPHYHESTAIQVSSGMTGALIVKGGLDDIDEIKVAEDKIFLFQQIPFSKQGGVKYNTVEKYDAGFGTIDGWINSGRLTSINGQDLPKITLNTGELQRWRFIHGGVRESLNVRFKSPQEGTSSSELPKLYEIAVDGLSLGEDAFPGQNNFPLKDMDKKEIELEPGYRSDVLVKAEKPGIYYLIDESVPAYNALNPVNPEEQHLLAEVEVVSSKVADMPLPEKLAPKPFKSITSEEVGNNTRTITFNMDFSSEPAKFTADGEEYHSGTPERVLNLPLGAAEELTLVSERGSHPFHIHVNPFEVINDGEGNYKGWKDTIMVRKGKNVIIRTRYNPNYPGRTVYHCHILDHEDQGMMREVNFTKDISKP